MGPLEHGDGGPAPVPFTATAPGFLRFIAAQYGDREAQVRGESRLTYEALERRSAELARGLLAHGVGKGTRIAILMPNCPDYTLYFMAAARIGAIVAPLSTLYQAPELAWVLRHADIQVLITADRYLGHDYLARLELAFPTIKDQPFGRLALTEAPYLRSIFVWGACARAWAASAELTLLQSAADRPEINEAMLLAVESEVSPADGLCMIYTSGSTAHPKGVLHGHGPMIRQTHQKAYQFWGAPDQDRVVSLRPFFWIAGLSATLFHTLHTGGCLITPPDGSGASLRRMIEEEGATAVSGDEVWFRALSADPLLNQAGYVLYRVTIDCAALAIRGAVSVRYLNDRRAARGAPQKIPDDLIPRSYGMTETLGAHTSLPAGTLLPQTKVQWSGRAIAGVRHRIVDPNNGAIIASGGSGELQVAGDCMMLSLYKKERFEVFTSDAYYATGDLCMIDADGLLKFVSRLGEMLKIHGANVAPLEVELRLSAFPEIERAAVVGVAGNGRDVVLVAAVQVRPDQAFDEAALRNRLRGELSSFKIPKRLFALSGDDFPVTASGKIKKPALAKLLGEMLAAEAA